MTPKEQLARASVSTTNLPEDELGNPYRGEGEDYADKSALESMNPHRRCNVCHDRGANYNGVMPLGGLCLICKKGFFENNEMKPEEREHYEGYQDW